jgi:CDP-2,3-bis-(O-geranylgeranyl)-sn-glycerol synthase
MLNSLIAAIQIFLPAYLANGAPTLLINYKKHPIDFGKYFGKSRVFGNGKTWEGLVFACFAAFIAGIILKYAYFWLNLAWIDIHPFGYAFIGLGAMVGDLAGSFAKRRLGMSRGENAGLLDKMDFIIRAMVFARVIVAYSWVTALLVLAATPIIHRAANIFGYKVGIKKEPW